MGVLTSMRRGSAVAVLVGCLISVAYGAVGDGGSKCADTSCTGAPPGSECTPAYGEHPGDDCCPVWHCTNGQTAYGMSKSSGGASFTSFSSSSGNGGPALPMLNPFGGGGFGQGGNPFANMFGNMFGR